MNTNMLKLALLCSILILVSTKLNTNSINSKFFDPDDEDLNFDQISSNVDLKLKEVLSEHLWVLEIDDFLLSSVTLWAGNMDEEKEFDDAFGPLMARYEGRQWRVSSRKEQNSEESTDNDDEVIVKGKIMRALNKFALSAMSDPNSYLFDTEDNDESPSLTLYFKGPFSSLSVKTGSKKWRYFISPPSPLPRWFYEKHDNLKRTGQAMYVMAPKSVEKEFYKSLLNLLYRFLSVPV